ncbi:hypothetical protein [Paracoccus sp. R86501]|uniref:hypothetical protein n=1 Tax=Paracoccus sp. R86501 TaxID=3101711 RepID=UPI0036720EE8
MTMQTSLIPSLAILLALALPAGAQDTATPEPSVDQSAQVQPDQDDDDDDDATGDEDGVFEAAGKFDYGFSGLLARDNRTQLAPLTLASGQPVAGGEYTLKSGGYYRIEITADGSQELALSGGDFFRAIWINEIVIGDTEIRPMGIHSLEFDSDGTAVLSFVAVLPGRYTLSVPGSSGDSLQAVFNIQ